MRSIYEDDHGDAAVEGGPSFSIGGRAAFYFSLLRRYRRLFVAMLVSTATYAVFNASRAALGGLMFGALQYHFTNDESVEPSRVLQLFFHNVMPYVPGAHALADIDQLKVVETFMQFVLAISAIATVAAIVLVIANFFMEYLSQLLVVRIIVCVRQALFGHLTRQSVAYFNRQRSGDVTSRLTNDINTIQLAFRFLFQAIVQQPFTILVNLALALYASPLLFVCVIPFYGVLMWPIFRSSKKVFKHGRGRLEKLSLVTEGIQQLFSGIRIVKAFGMEKHEREAFLRSNEQYVRSTMRMNRAKIKARSFQELLYNLGSVVLLLGGMWLLSSQFIELTNFSMFSLAMLQIYTPVKTFSRGWNQLQESAPGVDRVLEVLHEKPQLEDRDGAREFESVRESIRYDHVSFAYDVLEGEESAQHVLHDIDFEVKAGQVVAFVGHSGAGKSTIVDLLARFYDPQKGRILVDGVDIREFRHASYLRGIAIVSQDPFLFNTTIRDNIRYGRSGASDAEVEEAARIAFAHDFIVEQPEGYETILGERGVKLSGGQRQRLTIARAVLKDAPILILDEATSALDTFSEKEVQKAMENLMRSRTTFVIAHRLSTVVHATKIIVLECGRIIEEGTHEALLARRGRYFFLWRSQNPSGTD